MRYFLKISYYGPSFHGWQIQPNAITVQSSIETALSKLFRSDITITGAGRTDTGVHAREMYAHFDTTEPISDFKRILLSLNSLTGKDILISDIFEVPVDAHARFDATERTYKYMVSFNKNPFLKNLCWFSPSTLNIERMNEAANQLLSTTDFTSFAKLHSDNKTNICNVIEAKWNYLKEDLEASEFIGNLNDGIVFTIKADRFLRNMVRAIVGTLIDVGRNKISISDFAEIIKDKNRGSAGTSMPGNGLFLWHISYPFI